MQKLQLVEHQELAVDLTVTQRDQLKTALERAVIQPVPGSETAYLVNPKNHVGVVRAGDLTVEITPKLEISRVLFLVAYALSPRYWRDHVVQFDDAPTLHEAIARPFADFSERAIRRGPLHGYRTIDESLPGVKGRIRFGDQIRRRQRITTPLEVSYDEFTADIEENRLILAAAVRLLKMRFLSKPTNQVLRHVEGRLRDVSSIRYDRRKVPNPAITRLNRHYERPLGLARLVLGDETIELSGEAITSSGILFDMANVFETFVHVALREALKLSVREFPKNAKNRDLCLDDQGRVRLRPDLSWWERDHCLMVGDVKYKKTVDGEGKEPDLYQMLAYTTAAKVDTGFLIYAAGEAEPAEHVVPSANKRLVVTVLDLSARPEAILAEIQELAARIVAASTGSLVLIGAR